MSYKWLLKLIQVVIDDLDTYRETICKSNYIKGRTPILVAVKVAFRSEMTKTVRAVDMIAKDAKPLWRKSTYETPSFDDCVQRLIDQSLRLLKSRPQGSSSSDWDVMSDIIDTDAAVVREANLYADTVSDTPSGTSNTPITALQGPPVGTKLTQPKRRLSYSLSTRAMWPAQLRLISLIPCRRN